MKFDFRHVKIKPGEIIAPFIIIVLVFVGTFPENDWSFTIGIDSPLKWVFNWLFENGLNRGKHIIFPHGPLAFFMYPLSENILLATLVNALLKAIIVFGATGLFAQTRHPGKWLIIAVFAYGISVVANFNQLLLASVILLYLNYYEHRFIVLKLGAFLLTAVAFYVKAYVAILTGTFFVSFLVYNIIKKRKIQDALIDASVMLIFMLLFQIAMYGTPAGFLHYLWGMLHLAQDNSSAAALYPSNNWILLVFSLLSIVLIFSITHTPKTWFFATLFTLSIFAAWKHGMAREDFYHVKRMLIYLVILLSAFLLFERKKWPLTASLVVVAILLFGLNMKNSKNYQSMNYQIWQGKHFSAFIGQFNELKSQAHQKTADNLISNRLSENMLDSISDHTVDVYPWDYSVAAINNLNWQPRPVIQSYAVYTSWLDQQNADHWNSERAPEFIIWDKQKITNDVNKGAFNSIDSRYLLNDEPKSLIQLLRHYRPCCSDEKFLLLKKRKSALAFQENLLNETETSWNEWVDVPQDTTGLIRCQLHFDKSLKQKLKSFFYKDEQFWIYLKLSNGTIHKYRIVPKNAADGLWINPYLFDFQHYCRVEQILFKSSNPDILKPELRLGWKQIKLLDRPNYFVNYFGVKNTSDSLLYQSTHTFESPEMEHWKPLKQEQVTNSAYSGQHAFRLENAQFSTSFSYELNGAYSGRLKICADAWIKVPSFRSTSAITLVMELKDENGQYLYQSTRITQQVIEEKGWNHIYFSVKPKELKPNSQLSVYFWSPEKEPFYLDDFSVRISAVPVQ